MKIIDVHTHGISGFDTRTSSEDHICRIAEIQGSHGVSEIIPTVYPSSVDTMRVHMQAIKKAMEKQNRRMGAKPAPAHHRPEAKIIGLHLEGPFLNPARCGALNAKSFLAPDERILKKLIEGFEDIIKIITIAPELEGAVALIKNMSDAGIIASMGHSDATYNSAEAGFHAGARGITHIFNAMRGIHHREPGIAGFGLMNKDVYIEVIADPFHLHSKMIEFLFSMKNPEKIIIVSDTVKASKLSADSQGIRGEDSRLHGGSRTIRESAEQLIQGGLDKEIIFKAISDNPARYVNTPV